MIRAELNWNSWTVFSSRQLVYMAVHLQSHVALTWLVQSLLGSSVFFFFFLMSYIAYNHQWRKELFGFFFFLFREMLPRLWEKRRGLKKPKSKSITQVYDKKKLGK